MEARQLLEDLRYMYILVCKLCSLYNLSPLFAKWFSLLLLFIYSRNRYPMLLVRGSESVFEASSGLLVDGCIDYIPRTVGKSV